MCLIDCFCFLRICTLLLIISCVKEPIDAKNFWISLQTHNFTNDFVWSTGETLSYTYWRTGQIDTRFIPVCSLTVATITPGMTTDVYYGSTSSVNMSLTLFLAWQIQSKLLEDTFKCQIWTLRINIQHLDKSFTHIMYIIL